MSLLEFVRVFRDCHSECVITRKCEKVKTYIKREAYEEIKRLVDCAVSANSKRTAEPYIKRLEFISNCGGHVGSANNILGELVASVKTAAGNVPDKQHWLGYVTCNLYKLEDFVEHNEQ